MYVRSTKKRRNGVLLSLNFDEVFVIHVPVRTSVLPSFNFDGVFSTKLIHVPVPTLPLSTVWPVLTVEEFIDQNINNKHDQNGFFDLLLFF